MESKLGTFLLKQIEAGNTTKKDLADAAGIQTGTLAKILSGRIGKPPMGRLEGFAETLGIDVAVLAALIA